MERYWREFMEHRDEGLGIVYERAILDRFLGRMAQARGFERVLEAPILGMWGVTGMNSMGLAARGVGVTLADTVAERLEAVTALWETLGLDHRLETIAAPDLGRLPFEDKAFDLAWNFVALWYHRDGGRLLAELLRVARLVLIVYANRYNYGYWLRKGLIDPEFFRGVDERWARPSYLRREVHRLGARVVEEGVLDVPPWPDTCFPVKKLWGALPLPRTAKPRWRWSGPDLYRPGSGVTVQGVLRLAMIEDLAVPWRLKLPLAHQRYMLVGGPGMSRLRAPGP